MLYPFRPVTLIVLAETFTRKRLTGITQTWQVSENLPGLIGQPKEEHRNMIDAPPNSIHPLTRAEWRAWLETNHTQTTGIWLINYKKATGKPRMEYEETVEEALCFGWIDSVANKLDDERSMQWFAPRKSGSGWSRPNKERVARLLEAGLIMPAGLAKISAAQQDGSWVVLDAVEALEIPPDLEVALAENPPATDHFTNFPRSVKRAILEWISNARRPETRAKRVEETARLAAANIRANQ